MPGAAYPSDFGHDFQKVKEAIDSGRWCVDWWEGDVADGDRDRTFYVRPATKGNEGLTHDPSWGGECVFLGEKGCVLSSEERPTECRHLVPNPKFRCVLEGIVGKKGAAIAWLPFEKQLHPDNWEKETHDEKTQSHA